MNGFIYSHVTVWTYIASILYLSFSLALNWLTLFFLPGPMSWGPSFQSRLWPFVIENWEETGRQEERPLQEGEGQGWRSFKGLQCVRITNRWRVLRRTCCGSVSPCGCKELQVKTLNGFKNYFWFHRRHPFALDSTLGTWLYMLFPFINWTNMECLGV